MKRAAIPLDAHKALLEYLSQRPFREVCGIMPVLENALVVEIEITPDDPDGEDADDSEDDAEVADLGEAAE